MKSVKRAVQVVACGLCAMAVVPTVHAKAERGFYLGLSAGKSSYDIDKGELDDAVISGFAAAGARVISGSSTLEDGDTSTAIVMGYRFMPYISLEASYLDLGSADYRSSGTVRLPGSAGTATATVGMTTQTTGLTIAGIGSIPIGEVFDLHGRLGLFVNNTETTISAAASTGPSSVSDSSSDTASSAGTLVGVGAAFHIGGHFSLSFDWTRYLNVGDENEDDDFGTTEGFDVDAMSLTALYKF